MIKSFHDVRFPTGIALGAVGGPERRTEIISLANGHEQRIARWAGSRRRFNAAYGVKTLDDLSEIISFFEERRGRLFGFRFRDPLDNKSCSPASDIQPTDQKIGIGDGETRRFQLRKSYGTGEAVWHREISKPVQDSLRVAAGGMLMQEGSDYVCDYLTGEIEFSTASVPASETEVFAGFEFDVPVRFDTDEVTVSMSHFLAGEFPPIPLIEILS